MKSLHVGAMVVLTAAAARTFAALPTNGLVAAGSHAEVTVTGQTNVAGLAVSGTLEKRGAGELVLTNLYSLPGTVWAREGTVTLAEAGLPVSLPAALQRGLAFWVDAATNVVTDGSGRVDKWLDVRESSTIEPYAYMRAEHDYTYYPNGPRARNPILASGNASVNSLPMVDFGTFGATNSTAAWLPWRKKDGTRGVVTNIHAVFAVATFTNSNGHFLSDWDYCAEGPEMTNRFGSADFNQGSSVDTLCYRLFSTSVAAYRSSLYVNGVQADGDRPPDMLGQILEVVSPASLTAANFFNYRNSDRSASLPNIGGGQLGEVLVYTNALTEAERLSIEGYLFRKWKRETRVGSVRIQSGASAVSVVDGSGTTNRLWSVSGDGDWHKIGAGTAGLINDSSLMYGSVQLGEGTLVDDGYVRRPNRLFAVPDSGLMVRSDTNRWECVSTVATNAVVKTGAGALTVTDFPTNVTHVAVSGGTLRLTQALCDPERVEPLAVYNNSFEIFDNHDNHGPWSDPAQVWGFLPTGTGWTVLGYAEDGKSVGGIYKPDGSSVVWCAKQPAPEGEWVAFIKQGGGWETTFNVSVPGYHRLVFYTTGRYLNGKHQYNVLIDGQVIAQIMTIQILFERREFVLPWLSDGQHTLTFQGVDDGRDQTSLLDDVRIERIGTAQAAGIVTNGGFEISAPLTDTWGGGRSRVLLFLLRGYECGVDVCGFRQRDQRRVFAMVVAALRARRETGRLCQDDGNHVHDGDLPGERHV